MNISFHHKVALGLIALTLFLVSVWRHDFRSEEPRHKALLTSIQNDLRDRDQLSSVLEELNKTKANIERVAAQGKIDDAVGQSLSESLNGLLLSGDRIFAGQENPFKQLSADASEFFKIAGQLALYEAKLDEFAGGFNTYFLSFQSNVNRWKETTAAAIVAGETINNAIPFTELNQRVSTLEKVIPEVSVFKQRLQSLAMGFDQWSEEINAAKTIEEKQAAFAKKEFLLKGVPELFATFNQYIQSSGDRERANVQQIARQITVSLADIQIQVQDKYAVKNNSIQTVMAQAEYKDSQYRKIKYVVAGLTFMALIFFFFVITIYAFRFERGLAIFRRKTFEAAQTTREITTALKNNSSLAVQNFDLASTLKEGLENVSQGFLARQGNLQQVDQLVRDTDALIKESQQNFMHIKTEFDNAEKVSKEIVNLTSALEGIAQQMTSVAERVSGTATTSPEEIQGKEKTIDELKYLAGRIRYSVNATHTTLDGRVQQIEEAKAKFALIEDNMTQMTENTKQALRGLALARLDHSEEVSRINEILENAKTTSRGIVSEIETLNKQINDFSALSKHLAALHELAVKASALNAQSLLTEDKASSAVNSQRMNAYVQEYFKKVFENPAIKANQSQPATEPKSNRIQAAADV
jgi:hypothetical protein